MDVLFFMGNSIIFNLFHVESFEMPPSANETIFLSPPKTLRHAATRQNSFLHDDKSNLEFPLIFQDLQIEEWECCCFLSFSASTEDDKLFKFIILGRTCFDNSIIVTTKGP